VDHSFATGLAAAPDDDMRYADIALALGPDAPGKARRAVRSVLDACGVRNVDLRADAALVASELVTNAVRHGGDRLGLELDVDLPSAAGDPDPDVTEGAPVTVRVAVRDGSAVLPRPQVVDDALADAHESGRGLVLVAAVADDWGTETTPEGGKRVWALLRGRWGAVPDPTTA
jgi:anti-sigma regulatory factor (Ser/Thr protein kinase)